MVDDDKLVNRQALTHMPRSRGAVSGLLIVLLGAWGALAPFIGPAIKFGYSPDSSWKWTSARGWLEVLPGVVAVVGGLLLLTSNRRIRASLGGWLAAAAGAWFVVGPTVASTLHLGSVGSPLGTGNARRALETLALFLALGAALLFLGAFSIGRLSVRSLRDVHAAQRRIDKDREREELERARVEEQVRADEQRRRDEELRLAEERRATEESERQRDSDRLRDEDRRGDNDRGNGPAGFGESPGATRLEPGADAPTATFPASSGPGTFPAGQGGGQYAPNPQVGGQYPPQQYPPQQYPAGGQEYPRNQ